MQKSHTKVLLLSFFVPTTKPPTAFFERSSTDNIDRSNADVRRDIREPYCPPPRPVCLRFLKLFELFASRVSTNCGCLWTKWDTTPVKLSLPQELCRFALTARENSTVFMDTKIQFFVDQKLR